MKPLLKVKTTVKISGVEAPTWELVSILPSSLMHAVWNPDQQVLVCQFDSVKENFIDYPVKSKAGSFNWQERRAEQYYRLNLTDTDAIKHLLDNYVDNYKGEEFIIKFEQPEQPASKPEAVEEEKEELTTE
jgi:hypothetical protein